MNAERVALRSWTAHWKFRMDGHKRVNDSRKQCEIRWPWTQNFERIAETRCLAERAWAKTKNNLERMAVNSWTTKKTLNWLSELKRSKTSD